MEAQNEKTLGSTARPALKRGWRDAEQQARHLTDEPHLKGFVIISEN